MAALGTNLSRLVLVLLPVTFGVFIMVDALPGSPATAILGEAATPESTAALEARLGLDRPLPVRYATWLANAATGDLGRSVRTGQPVSQAISERLPVTLQLAATALVIALLVSVPLGLWSAWARGGRVDQVTGHAAFGLIAAPQFLIGLVLVYFVADRWQLLPPTGWVRLTEDPVGNLRHALLPALALAATEIGVFVRIVRSDTVTTLQETYILAAQAKGVPTGRLLVRHTLRPSSLSLVTLAGITAGRLIGGTLVVEYLFGLPGLGTMMINSVITRDWLALQGAVLVVATAAVVLNIAVDMLYALLDPRIRSRGIS